MYQRNKDCEKCGSKVYYIPRDRSIFCRCGEQNKIIKAFSSWHEFWKILGGETFHEVDNRNMFTHPKNNGALR